MNWRRNINSLSPVEKGLVINAVKLLKSPYFPEPPTGPTNIYNKYVTWHWNSGEVGTPLGDPYRTIAHSGPAFLPWHREFIRKFELDLQKIQKGITLPYWNWAEDSGLPDPKSAPVWDKNFMGGDGDPKDNSIVKSGPFAVGTWVIADENGRPSSTGNNPQGGLQRALGRAVATLPTLNDVNSALGESPYDVWPWNPLSSSPTNRKSFRNKLEGNEGQDNMPELHSRLHAWVGGSMIPFTSPNDPVFFLHHCYVDRVWDRWQIGHRSDPNADYPADGAITTELNGGQRIDGHNRDDLMPPWNDFVVSNVLDSLLMGVEYDPGNHAITAVATGSDRVVVFWIGSNGSVNYRSYVNTKWEDPVQWAGSGSASVPSGSITAIFNTSLNQLHLWWTKPDSTVAHFKGGYNNDGQLIWGKQDSAAYVSSTTGGLGAIFSKGLPFIFSIGCDSQVWWEYWNETNWVYKPLTSMNVGSTSSGLAAITRSDNFMDYMWIEGDGSIRGREYDYSNGWQLPYQIAEPYSAWGNSIVAVSRDTDKMDVWWVGPPSGSSNHRPYDQNGYLYWNSFADGQWKGKLAINSGASIRGGLAAVSRGPNNMEVYWIYNGTVYGMSWDSSKEWGGDLYTIPAGPAGASTSGGLVASKIDGNNIALFWIGSDKTVVGTNLIYQQGRPPTQNRLDVLPINTSNFQTYAASTGFPSDVAT